MPRGPKFTKSDTFQETIKDVKTARGKAYKDVNTIEGDMARWAEAKLATMSAKQFNKEYNDLGWKGSANGRGVTETARKRLLTHNPDMADKLGIRSDSE